VHKVPDALVTITNVFTLLELISEISLKTQEIVRRMFPKLETVLQGQRAVNASDLFLASHPLPILSLEFQLHA
jgi:hypothetical protein